MLIFFCAPTGSHDHSYVEQSSMLLVQRIYPISHMFFKNAAFKGLKYLVNFGNPP